MDDAMAHKVAEALGAADGPAVLDRLLALCVAQVPVDGAVISIIDQGQHRGSLASSDERATILDDVQFGLGEGPALVAAAEARPVFAPNLAEEGARWPGFAPAALAQGVAAAFAVPLQVGAILVGVLLLLRSEPGDLQAEEARSAFLLGRILTHTVLDLEAAATPGRMPVRLLGIALHRAPVHQATGMAAMQLDTDVATAMGRIRAYAWATDRSLDDVAADIVAGRLRMTEP